MAKAVERVEVRLSEDAVRMERCLLWWKIIVYGACAVVSALLE